MSNRSMYLTLTMFIFIRGPWKMQKNEELWYRIGYALEAARQRVPVAQPKESDSLSRRDKGSGAGVGARERLTAALKASRQPPLDEASSRILDAVLTVGAGTVLTRLLSLWPGRRRPGLFRLLKAGAAGAAASFLAGLIRPVTSGKPASDPLEDELADLLLSGAGRGLLYAAIVEPRIPGPSLLQGSVYGALEYALTPWGGLEELAGAATPHGKIPVLSVLLKGRGEEEQLLEHLAFGIALALLYEG